MRRLLLLAAAFGAAACAHRSRPAPPPPAPLPIALPTVAFAAVQVERLEFLGADLRFRARVESTNPFALSVARVDYALQLEGRPAASGSVGNALVIPAADAAGAPGAAEIDVPVHVSFAAVPGVAPVLASDGDAAYALGGAVTFLTPAGEVRVPLAHSGRVAVPRLPRVRVESAVLRSASAREVTVELRLAVENPNAFPVPPGRIGYGLFLSNREVVRADVELPAPLGGGESASVGAPVRISPLKAGKAAARLLVPFTSLDVKVKGEAVFGGVPVPLDLAARLSPGR